MLDKILLRLILTEILRSSYFLNGAWTQGPFLTSQYQRGRTMDKDLLVAKLPLFFGYFF